ncbi:hypothetical protein GPOL_c47670 [Gordonia polyisoprenivorans VH2]|uniref:Uncharacterized protein n=1 Tax=Gordonia polyisoprenivorans (strain DSM 44266 / VH2) TaxID=1112204 RepID=H6N0A8_GORPV|nr:hypothetical protein [Gordonia polyisoprenivorans]AFA75765.1 hypothetical protein GPOL_c47670 [Gordonia polyisoprenivorans VH2]
MKAADSGEAVSNTGKSALRAEDEVGQDWILADKRLTFRTVSRVVFAVYVGAAFACITGVMLIRGFRREGQSLTVPAADDLMTPAWGLTALAATLSIALVVRTGGASRWHSDMYELVFWRRGLVRVLMMVATVTVGAATLQWFATPKGSVWASLWVIGAAAIAVAIAAIAPDEPSMNMRRQIQRENEQVALYAGEIRRWTLGLSAATPRAFRRSRPLLGSEGARNAIAFFCHAIGGAALFTLIFVVVDGWTLNALLWGLGWLGWMLIAPAAGTAVVGNRSRLSAVCSFALSCVVLGIIPGGLVLGLIHWTSAIWVQLALVVASGTAVTAVPLAAALGAAASPRRGRVQWVLWLVAWPTCLVSRWYSRYLCAGARHRRASARRQLDEDRQLTIDEITIADEVVGRPRDTTADRQDWRGSGYL